MPREGETMSEESRRIAEALGPDRDRRAREARQRAERRERIATAALSGLTVFGVTSNGQSWDPRGLAVMAADAADALMAELDRRRDAELQEAR